MKRLYAGVALVGMMGLSVQSFAGNKDRTGQAGATELLINPWGQSTGLFFQNTATVKGLEAMKTNIGGLAYVDNLEFGVAHSQYLAGIGVTVNNLGIAQKVGSVGVLGLNIASMGFGEITVTDFNNPEGNGSTFKPSFFNIQLGFAKEFSKSIHAGIGVTYVTEQIADARASGAAFEAGVQYTAGKRDNFHIGITLRNVGTNMKFSGAGFSISSEAPESEAYQLNRQTPTQTFQMPTYLAIGTAYDFFLDENHMKGDQEKPYHRLTAMANFTSNSFLNDYLGGGLEYSFKEMLMLRGSYRWEQNIGNENSVTMYTGFSAGATVQKQFKNGSALGVDYSYRPTQRPSNGVHVFSLRYSTASKKTRKDALK
ncbi:MAG: PorV/PorQ family protein [Flavipsychrobacter sp.]|nr:PorV/PorQ family protein [Flavipsychrobacter sp.]